jgi:hypothetical protein
LLAACLRRELVHRARHRLEPVLHRLEPVLHRLAPVLLLLQRHHLVQIGVGEACHLAL